MSSPEYFWNKRLSTIDIDTYDFSVSNHEATLDLFCEKYLQEGDSVIDLGCGGGRNARYLAKMGFRTYGVDFSELAVDFCRKVSIKLNLQGTFGIGYPDNIPFPDDFFSAAICIAVLDHVVKDKARKAISEMCRVTKPGAAMIITFDPIDRVDIFKGEAKQLPDGSLHYIKGEKSGLVFRQYSDEEIIDLIGEDKIISFEKDDTGHRVVIFS